MAHQQRSGRELVPGFAALVRREREALGWSCQRLADEAGVSFNTVYAVEAEDRAPSLRVASALVRALGLRVWLSDPAKVV